MSSTTINNTKIALVHDFLLYPGGAEKVLAVLAEMFPEAPIYTLLHDAEGMKGQFADREIHTSFLQRFPRWMRKRHQWLLPFMSTAPETFDLREFDLVISSSGAWSKGLVTRLDTRHIAYIHSPMRYVWDAHERYAIQARGKKHGLLVRMLLSYLRVWDYDAAQRPDVLVANSDYTKRRIAKYYRRDATVVYPGTPGAPSADTNEAPEKKHFLVVSRLSGYKNVALAIDVFNKLSLPLVVIGEGAEQKKLEQLAGPTVEVRGWQDEAAVAHAYRAARAFVFPAEDDFGLTMVESLSYGVPVLALRAGGAPEIIEEGVTGEFFDAPVASVCADAVRRFLEKEGSYDVAAMHAAAAQFSTERFRTEMMAIVNEQLTTND